MSSAALAPDVAGASPATLSPRAIAKLATRALWDELTLCPKPGLVSLRDAGAHDDMSARTFVQSLFALRRHFAALAAAGAAAAPFATLRALGVRAEADMLRATGGVNTHRGAIFCVGLLCAAAARARAIGDAPDDDTLRAVLRGAWGSALDAHVTSSAARSHGAQVAQRHGAGGARVQAAQGFPDVFDTALPALRAARTAGAGVRVARLRALLALMARVDDTNVLYRGGGAGLRFVQQQAREASASADIVRAAEAMHGELVARRLSPGGCADLLAAALFVDAVQDAAG
jgi:triphosphoribosyl-dephospho-CoA synthase